MLSPHEMTRTFDYRKVKKLANWPVPITTDAIYLLDGDVGLWSFHKHKDGLMIHADMSDKCRGRKAIDSMQAAFCWIFGNTDTKKIYARVPAKNKPACYMAAWSGMKFIAVEGTRRCYEVTP